MTATDTKLPRPRTTGPRAARLLPFRRVARLSWLVVAVALVFYPLTLLFRESFRGDDAAFSFENYALLVRSSDIVSATFNSLWIGIGSTLGALVIAVPVAFLVSRTDLPGRRMLRSVAVLTFAAPTYIAALGWVLLLGPRAGIINEWLMDVFGLESAPFDVFSPWGIIFVLSLLLYPLVLLPVASGFDNMDLSLEQAAADLGANRWQVLRQITLPVLLPALAAGSMLTFVTAFVIFGPVAILGGPVGFDTIPTLLLRLTRVPGSGIAEAAVVAVPVLVVIAGLTLIQRKMTGGRSFALIGGKATQRATLSLGRWRWPAFLACLGVVTLSVVLPFGILLLTSFRRALGQPLGADNFTLTDNYVRLWEMPHAVPAFLNSLQLAAIATVVSLVIAFLGAWLLERDRSWFRPVIQPTMLSSLAFPGAVLGIALIVAYAREPFSLAGGLAIIAFAYVVRTLPFSFSYVRAGLQQLGGESEEAARSLGAGWFRTFRSITFPLLRTTLLSAGILNFVLLFRELESSIFLYTGRTPVISVVLYTLSTESRFQMMGAFSIVVLVINIGMVLVATRLFGSAASTRNER